MYITRTIGADIKDRLLKDRKIVAIYGPRQCGKTTLSEQIIAELGLKTLKINADEKRYEDVLSSRDLTKLRSLVSGYDLVFIDEAQRIPEIGINLKIMYDDHEELKNIKFLITGSSSLDLASKVRESLTGRTWSYTLFPISIRELSAFHNRFELDQMVEERLLFGSYPHLFSVANAQERWAYLYRLTTDYLYHDLETLVDIKNPGKLRDMLQLLALQIGSEVSRNELANRLDLSRDAVYRYLHFLEESFVIFRVGGYGRNMRRALTRKPKYYFFDLGVRNAFIEAKLPLSARNDVGVLWENFLMIERLKSTDFLSSFHLPHFWRSRTGSAEIDCIEESGGEFRAYEFKWSNKVARLPSSFAELYPEAIFQTVNRNNWLDFVLDQNKPLSTKQEGR